MAGPIRIAIVGDVKDFEKSTAKVDAALEKTTSRSQKVGKAIDAGAKVAALGFLAAGAGALKLAQGAAEDQKAAAALAKTLHNTAGATKGQVAAVEDWITAQGKALGVADDQLRPALSALATATGDVGKAQKLTSLAMDISAGSGKSLETVTAALVRAQNGSVGGLSRLGIATKDASGKTKDFATLQDELSKKFAGQAATAAGTLEGKMGRLKLALSEAGESVGYMLIPVLVSLANWLNNSVVPALDTAFSWMENHQTTVKVVAIAVASLGTAFIAVSAAMKAYAAVQAVLNAVMAANPIGLVILAIAGLAAGLVVAYRKSETFRDVVNAAFAVVKVAGAALWAGLKVALNGIRTALSVIGSTASTVKDKITGAFDSVVAFIRGVPGKITALGGSFKRAGSALMDKIIEGIKSAAGFIGNIASSIGNAVAGMLNKAIDKINGALDFTIKIPGAPDLHVNAPNIPHVALATGGIVTRPTAALIGEAGPEAVIPLDRYDMSDSGQLVALLTQLLAAVKEQIAAQRDSQRELQATLQRAPGGFAKALNSTAARARTR